MEQMQREARAKLAGLAAQQLEAQQQERLRQQQQQQLEEQRQQRQRQQQRQQRETPSSASADAGAGIGASASGGSSEDGQVAGNATSAASPPSAASGRDSDDEATSSKAPDGALGRDRRPGESAESGNAAEARSPAGPKTAAFLDADRVDREWDAMVQELQEGWQGVKQRWRQVAEKPVEPPRPQQWRPQAATQRPADASAAAAGAGAGAATALGNAAAPLEVVKPQVVETDAAAEFGRVLGSDADPSSSQGVADAAADSERVSPPSTSNQADAVPASKGEEQYVRRTTVTRMLQLACVAVFVKQWAPVIQSLASGGGGVPGWDVALGLLLACPPTPTTLEWQTNAVAVASGQLGSLFSSALLHSGLLSLLSSLVSLEESAPWLESVHGFIIMLISYFMAGAGAALAQLLVGGQVTGIGGIGAVLGTEAAVAVRVFRFTGKPLPPTAACLVLCGVGLLMAAYQPLVGPWGIIGGLLGGALSGIVAFDVLYLMRVALGISMLTCIAAWNLVNWLPRALWRLLVVAWALAWGTLVAIVQAVRGV